MITLRLIGAPAFSVEVRPNGEFVYAAINDALSDATGLERETFVGGTPRGLFPGGIGERLVDYYRRAAETGKIVEYVDVFDLPSGEMWWRVTLTFVAEATEERLGFLLGVCSDVTAEKHAETELREAHVRLSLAFEALGGAYWQFDLERSAFEASPSLALLAGSSTPRPLALEEWRALILPQDRGQVTFGPLLSGEAEQQIAEYRIRRGDGTLRWMRCHMRLLRDDSGRPLRVLGVTLDITEQKCRELDLMREAARDSLTGLANRRGFDAHLSRVVAKAERTGQHVSLIVLDLDRFKPVNDRYGHAIGDQVLIEISKRIQFVLRPYDMAARLGGDEFVLVIEGLDERRTAAIAGRIGHAFETPFETEAGPISVGVSLGVATHHRGASPGALLREADSNLYAMKRERRALRAEAAA